MKQTMTRRIQMVMMMIGLRHILRIIKVIGLRHTRKIIKLTMKKVLLSIGQETGTKIGQRLGPKHM